MKYQVPPCHKGPMLCASSLVPGLVIVLLAVAGSATAQTWKRATPPPSGAGEKAAGAVTIEHLGAKATFETDGSDEREIAAAIRVESDAGVKAFAVLAFAYIQGDQTVDVDYVRVTKPDGTVVATPVGNVLDMAAELTRVAPMYSDIHEKHVAVKALGVGDLLEYRVRYHTARSQIPGHFWLAYTFTHDVVCKDEVLEVSVPRGSYVRVSTPELQPQVADGGRCRVYRWRSVNLEPQNSPQQLYERAGRSPSVQLTTFRSWDEIGRWYGALEKSRVVVSSAIKAKAAELTAGLVTDEDKIAALYRFVASRIHYVSLSFGVGRFQPHAAEEVLGNEYGDCKDKHTLLAALLKAAGYVAWPALINSSHMIDPDEPSPGQFDHVITVVQRSNDLWWLDTTPEVAPFRLLVPALRDKEALVIHDDGQAGLMCTPTDPPFPMDSSITATSRLDDQGTLTAHIERSDRSDVELLLRAAFRSVPRSNWQQLVQQISYSTGFMGNVSNVDASTADDTSSPFHISYDYKRTDYSDWENHRVVFPLPSLGLPHFPPDAEKPAGPILLPAPAEVVYRATLELPPGYTAEAPKPVDVTSDFAEYHATYSRAGRVLFTERRLTITKREVPLSDFEEYKRFEKSVSDNEWSTVALVSAAEVARTSANSQARRWYDQAAAAMQNRDPATAEDAIRHVLEIDPAYPRAHSMTGAINMARGETERGLAEFRKEMQLHPEDAYSAKMLAQTLSWMKRKSEAIDVWRQVLKADPSDRDAAKNLGELLLDAKRYAEAAETLEAAVKLNPDSADLNTSLGSAYLGTKQPDKALGALKKAVESEPTPERLNRAAYRMAESGFLLDQARKWAEQAVSKAEAESASTTLEHLRGEDLSRPGRLATYWDTLGWVCLRSGDLPTAERYLRAAWALSQRPTAGDHLGQLYEREGKKGDAARVYELAFASAGRTGASDIARRYKRLTGKSLEDGSASGGSAGSGGVRPVSTADEELGRLRTYKLPSIGGRSGNAEFWVLLAPGPKTEDAKFISGSQELRDAAKLLATFALATEFPDSGPTKLLRRGMLYCQSLGCDLILLVPDDVLSLE